MHRFFGEDVFQNIKIKGIRSSIYFISTFSKPSIIYIYEGSKNMSVTAYHLP